jgi:hypothetical protein
MSCLLIALLISLDHVVHLLSGASVFSRQVCSQAHCARSVAVKHASQPSGVVPLLTCKGYM